MKNLNNLAEECDEAINTASQEKIEILAKEIQERLNDSNKNKEKFALHYLYGNLCHALSTIINEDPSGWRNDNYPDYLTSEINHLRAAEKIIPDKEKIYKYEIETNLANAIAKQRRSIEVLGNWRCDFNI